MFHNNNRALKWLNEKIISLRLQTIVLVTNSRCNTNFHSLDFLQLSRIIFRTVTWNNETYKFSVLFLYFVRSKLKKGFIHKENQLNFTKTTTQDFVIPNKKLLKKHKGYMNELNFFRYMYNVCHLRQHFSY